MSCLFCRSPGPYSTEEHIFPESLGNKQLVLRGHVCDTCQRYFGTEVESFVLNKTVLGWGRLFARAATKKGKAPRIETTLPARSALGGGAQRHSDIVGTLTGDGRIHAEIVGDRDPEYRDGVLKLHCEFTPLVRLRLGQFSLKAGLETLCLKHPDLVRATEFDEARKFAREGSLSKRWPIFSRILAATPGKAEKCLSYELSPYHEGSIWFEFVYVGVAFRVDLLSSREHLTPEGYVRVA